MGLMRGGVAQPFYLAGGVAPEDVVAVYQPLGADNLATSYVNLVNPGTFDAAPGVAPTFGAQGWTFNGSTQYLTTGVVGTATMTIVIRYSGITGYGTFALIGGRPALEGSERSYFPNIGLAKGFFYGGIPLVSGGMAADSGVAALAGESFYFNGSHVIDAPGPFEGAGGALYIGARNIGGTADMFRAGVVQAVALYSAKLTAGQVAAVSAAMAAV